MISIYKIESPTGKIYIGQSKNYLKRLQNYKNLECKSQIKLYNSFLKHGVKSHIFSVLHSLPSDAEQTVIDCYEVFYWEQFIACGFSTLNMKTPGKVGKRTKESIEKQLLSRGKYSPTLETRAKMRLSNLGQKRSNQAKLNIKNNIKKGVLHHKTGVGKAVIDIKSGVSWPTIKSCAEYLGIKPATLKNKLRGFRLNNTNIRYLNS